MTRTPVPIDFPPIRRDDFHLYAHASGDMNPLHLDPAQAQAAGLPDVMAQGMYSAALLAGAVERWFGAGAMTRYGVRFRLPVWPGDRLQARCLSAMAVSGNMADLDLGLFNAAGQAVLSASARVRVEGSDG
ncbi:MAG: MaoC family dehydratase [Paracoccaceae bacterium]